MEDDHPNVLHGPPLPLEIPKITLGQFIFSRLKSHNPYDVLMFESETGRLITPAEFLSLSLRVAEALKEMGLERGDVVCIMGKAKIDVYATATGTLFQGGTVSPIDHNLPPDVFRLILRATRPRIVLCDAEIAELVSEVLAELENRCPVVVYNADSETSHQSFEQFVQTEVDFKRFRPVPSEDTSESVAFLICSSGTMGIPKPVMITDRNLMYQATVWGILASFNKILACPAVTFSFFFWISGVLMYLMVISMNFELTIVQRLEARHVLEVIDRQKPVWGIFSPALVKYITWQPYFKNYNVSSLMLMLTGGTSMQKVVVDRVKELWGPHLSCRQAYGVTELSGVATASALEDDVMSVGRLIPGFHMKVISLIDGSLLGPEEEGELYMKSPSLMKGYKGNEKATMEALKDGWYKTGDLGKYTATGLIHITGRVKDLIRFNDAMVSPVEIEEVILALDGVADAGVVSVPLDDGQQLPVAIVVLMPETDVTQEDIIQRISDDLPEDRRMEKVFFVNTIPRTPSGKMKRGDLLEKAKALIAEE